MSTYTETFLWLAIATILVYHQPSYKLLHRLSSVGSNYKQVLEISHAWWCMISNVADLPDSYSISILVLSTVKLVHSTEWCLPRPVIKYICLFKYEFHNLDTNCKGEN